MQFEQYLTDSEKTLSATFHYDENDPGENKLRQAVEEFIIASEKLDKFKKTKFYGKPLDDKLAKSNTQMSVQQFDRDLNDPSEKLTHAMIGIATESGELLKAIYDSKWGGKQFDVVNCEEELGDLFWYKAILFREFGFKLSDVLQKNTNKLQGKKGRYKNQKFSSEEAINRDLDSERKILESNGE